MFHRAVTKLRRFRRFQLPAIVMYHRVADIVVDPWGLAVSPQNFATQIALMRSHRTILSLADFIRLAKARTLPKGAVALTFDDGYHDNLTAAGPLLANYDVPAPLFLATRPAERGMRYWWDELAGMVLNAPPTEAFIEIGGKHSSIRLAAREPADDARGGWRAWDPRTTRERLHYELWSKIRPLAPSEIDLTMRCLRSIFQWQPDTTTRAMTQTEIGTFIAMAPIAIGGHTTDHVDLPSQDTRSALDQILRSREVIEHMTGYAPVAFAYPYGRHDYTTRMLVAAAGFECACTTEYGFVHYSSDILSMPRFAAPDVPNIDWLS